MPTSNILSPHYATVPKRGVVTLIMIRKNLLNCKLNFDNYSSQEVFNPFLSEFRPEFERCPFCNALGQCKRHGSYERCLTDIKHGEIVIIRVKIPRVICSCGRTHGAIPDYIVPYRWYSLPFILHILILYFSGSMTIEKLCETYGFSHSTLYRWKFILSEHKLWWLTALVSNQTAALDFIRVLLGYDVFSDFTRKFFHKTLYSFLQLHINPANCRHLPLGLLPVQGAPT